MIRQYATIMLIYIQISSWLVSACALPTHHVILAKKTTPVLSPIISLSQPSWLDSLAVSPDGRYLAIALGTQNQVTITDIASRRIVKTLKTADRAGAVTFARKSNILAVAYGFGKLAIWDTGSWQKGFDFTAYSSHSDDPGCVSFTPDNRGLVTSNLSDFLVKIWDTASGLLVRELRLPKHAGESILSPDGNILAIDATQRNHRQPGVMLIGMKSGKTLRTLGGDAIAIGPLAFSPTGDRLATSDLGAGINVWLIKAGRLMFRSKIRDAFSPTKHSGSKMREGRIGMGRLIPKYESQNAYISCLAFSPRGNIVATGDIYGVVRLIDSHNGTSIAVLKGHIDRVAALAFTPDGKILITGSNDQTVKFWNVSKYRN